MATEPSQPPETQPEKKKRAEGWASRARFFRREKRMTRPADKPAAPRLTHWYHQSGAVEIGPLLMAYRPEENWAKLENGDWQVTTDDMWNWALLRNEPMKAVYDDERTAAFGKGDPGLRVLVKAVPIDWDMDGASAASVPMAPKSDARAEVIELVPYGDTALRIAQFPVANESGK